MPFIDNSSIYIFDEIIHLYGTKESIVASVAKQNMTIIDLKKHQKNIYENMNMKHIASLYILLADGQCLTFLTEQCCQ